MLALTNDDEDNLMVSVLVEKFAKDQKEIDDKRTMALINKLIIHFYNLHLRLTI